METRKMEVLAKIEEKGLSVEKVAEQISFSPLVLDLYFAKDAYPVPERILSKIETALAS